MTSCNPKRIGILIAVRMKSARLSNKALGDIVGKPLIVHLIERMRSVRNCDGIVLCTSTHPDDRILLDIADQAGIHSFAGDEIDVMKRFIDAAEQFNMDILVRVTGDNPLTDPQNIDRMIETCLDGELDFVKSEYLPLGVNAEVVTLETLKKAHSLALDTSLTEYMTSYLKRPDLFKIHTVGSNDLFFEKRSKIRLTVDFEEDLQVMRQIYDRLYPDNPAFGIREVLELLDAKPEILDINANMLEIPLPKIHFKGQNEYAKKLVAVVDDLGEGAAELVGKINKLKEFDLVGLVYHGDDFQYTLIEGVPILGRYSNLNDMVLEAGYFYVAIEDLEQKDQIARQFIERGLERVA